MTDKNKVIQFPTNKNGDDDIEKVLDIIREVYEQGELRALIFGMVLMDDNENLDDGDPLHVNSASIYNGEEPSVILSMINYLNQQLEEETGVYLDEDVTEYIPIIEGENEE